ncbi:MAG: hypothetical protein ACYCPT_07270 [Acidimicrobiales bacterium]
MSQLPTVGNPPIVATSAPPDFDRVARVLIRVVLRNVVNDGEETKGTPC